MNIRGMLAIGFILLTYTNASFAATRTVAKTGADFTTISAAIVAAAPGDMIVIMDTETYEEQVTIDSTKYPLIIKSNNPLSLTKPTIKYKDTLNVGPRTYAESKDRSKLTFDRNGALRLLNARNVILDGIAISGGEPFVFGYKQVWNGTDPLQYGNSAIAVWQCGGIIIRNCDISNAYIGISFKDRNVGGIFSNPNSGDLDTSQNIPMSRYGLMGNHLIERNRIHNNSFGIYSESSWDLGSTVRYNLIYENHHATEAFQTKVLNLTDEGANHPGGAFMFKDVQLSPLSIYNNTFWHNFIIFAGHWQAGYQHLVFNNIFGVPNKYWQSVTGFSITAMELTPVLINRICNSVFSAQVRPPQPGSVTIMLKIAQLLDTVDMVIDPGTLLTSSGGFPASANNRWLEMDSIKFLSMNPASDKFLEPNWEDADVQNFIIQKGWQASGVKNTDGTWADLGAIEQAHGTQSFVGTINPVPSPITISGGLAQIVFTLDQRIGTLKDPVIKLLRLVKIKYKKDSFGSGEQTLVIGSGDMSTLTPPTTPPVQVGANSYAVTISSVADYAFIEMMVEATGADGKQFAMATGFLPYRKLDYKIAVEIHSKNGSDPLLSQVHVGDTVQLRLLPQKLDGSSFWSPLDKVSVTLSSGFNLMVPGNPPVPLAYPSGLAGGPDSKLVIFTGIPEGGIEHISAGGEWKDLSATAPIPFVGGTSIKVLPLGVTEIKAHPLATRQSSLLSNEVTINCFDLQGRRIFQRTFLTNKYFPFNSHSMRKLLPGLAGKAYLLDISVKDALSLKRTRSVREIVVRSR
jgi:hypothetical protein